MLDNTECLTSNTDHHDALGATNNSVVLLNPMVRKFRLEETNAQHVLSDCAVIVDKQCPLLVTALLTRFDRSSYLDLLCQQRRFEVGLDDHLYLQLSAADLPH